MSSGRSGQNNLSIAAPRSLPSHPRFDIDDDDDKDDEKDDDGDDNGDDDDNNNN